MRRSLILSILVALVLGVAAVALWPRADGILIEPANLEFSLTHVGFQERQFLIATNTTDRAVELERISVEGPFKVSRSSLVLEPQQSTEIVVDFVPEASGPVESRLLFESSALRGGERGIALSASAVQPPSIQVEPRQVSFGDVPLGTEAKTRLQISNTGEADLRIQSIAVTKPFRPVLPTVTIPSGESRGVELLFRPKDLGSFEERVILRSDDPRNPSVMVTLKGSAVEQAPDVALSVEPGAIDFGRVSGCEPRLKVLSLYNDGSDPLQISSIGIPEPFVSSPRSRVIGPGGTLDLPITFDPVAQGKRISAPLVIYSNDPEARIVTVSLSGERTGCSSERAAQMVAELDSGKRERPRWSRRAAFRGSGGGGSRSDSAGRRIDAGEAVPLVAGEGGGFDVASDPGDRGGRGDQGGRGGLDDDFGDPGDPGDPGADPDPIDPGSVLRKGSMIELASYRSSIDDFHLDDVYYDPDSGEFGFRGTLPAVDAALGEFFQFQSIEGAGVVDALGETTVTVPVTIVDAWGNETTVVLDLTTNESTTHTEVGEITETGQPLGADGCMSLVAVKTMEEGSFVTQPMRMVLNVCL